MHDYMQESPETHYPVFSTYASAVRAMLPALFLNPGVGLNAGGVLPEEKAAAAGRERLCHRRLRADVKGNRARRQRAEMGGRIRPPDWTYY